MEDTRNWFRYSCGQYIYLVLFISHQSDHQWYLLHLLSCLPSLPTCLANDSAESNPNPTSGARWPSAQQTWLNRLDWQERRIWWSKIWSESILVAGRCTLFCPADCPAPHWLQVSLPSPHYCPIAHWSREGIAMILQNPGKLSWEAWLLKEASVQLKNLKTQFPGCAQSALRGRAEGASVFLCASAPSGLCYAMRCSLELCNVSRSSLRILRVSSERHSPLRIGPIMVVCSSRAEGSIWSRTERERWTFCLRTL